MSDATKLLDARKLNCPLPILKAKKTINGMQSGETLKILATDPGAVRDFEAFANQTGHKLLESVETNNEFHFILEKA
ncbi:MAG: sulfurtransferase TusA family protein [Gammaproteobacteria bacterium]|nr:sulfurtransferase TusA family protein [Gammaproteobacteria bacterium]MYD76820.1 sulfurtransferase TusA family protein [Gammaproteobacteria bacterium]MYJ52671.1 sulfurtransferase TusA family protein [Gammaproteobacteria bacterium]